MDVACRNRCGNGNNGIVSLEFNEIMVQEMRKRCSYTTTNNNLFDTRSSIDKYKYGWEQISRSSGGDAEHFSNWNSGKNLNFWVKKPNFCQKCQNIFMGARMVHKFTRIFLTANFVKKWQKINSLQECQKMIARNYQNVRKWLFNPETLTFIQDFQTDFPDILFIEIVAIFWHFWIWLNFLTFWYSAKESRNSSKFSDIFDDEILIA